jgi:predicted ribosome quality control (RQC) complex YloA/Tae2 family protein
MANLHQINRGDTKVVLDNFYRNEPITIELKKDLSPQNNAANYYQKAKNRKKELGIKQKQQEACSMRLQENIAILEKIENAQFLKDLKPWLKEEKAGNEVPLKEKFRKFECQGFQIYVGKNAKNNDELTLKFAHKEDLWLHAKGVSGSHVIIKHKQMQSFPQPVITKAAEIAAHYSSSAGSQLVPVIFTSKKFVRKPKGANPGQVSVEKEEVILVEPKIEIN